MARHSRTNTDIKPIREIDIENASKDELIEYLCQTIQSEVEKGEDADCDLIRECSDWLDELTADMIVFTPEELKARLEATKNGKYTNTPKPHKPSHITHVTKRKLFTRVSILVASLVLLSFLSLSVMAMYAGYSSTWEYISMNVSKLFGLNPGETINEDDITVIKNTGTVKYQNMDEFLKAESLNILYPQQIPNNEKITEIRYVDETEGNYVLYLVFSQKSYSVQIFNNYISNLDMMENVETITKNDIIYYISSKEDTSFHAICQYNGFEYAIYSDNYEDLLTLINNMKG